VEAYDERHLGLERQRTRPRVDGDGTLSGPCRLRSCPCQAESCSPPASEADEVDFCALSISEVLGGKHLVTQTGPRKRRTGAERGWRINEKCVAASRRARASATRPMQGVSEGQSQGHATTRRGRCAHRNIQGSNRSGDHALSARGNPRVSCIGALSLP